MTRPEAARLVRERWERLGIGTPEEFPYVFSGDVENMLKEVADQATGNAPVKDSPTVGDSGVSTSARVDAPGIHSSLDHFTNRITRCVDKKLGREAERFA